MHDFPEILSKATAAIESRYFQLPVQGKEQPIYRERVYCYELYHQMRKNWPDTQYVLNGEVDKNGHRIIQGNGLSKTKPDFLVHTPGDMAGNFCIIEVKPVNAKANGIEKDLKTLTAYLHHGGYQHGVLLFYGHADPNRLIQKIQRIAKKFTRKIDLTRIVVLHHAVIASRAEIIIKHNRPVKMEQEV